MGGSNEKEASGLRAGSAPTSHLPAAQTLSGPYSLKMAPLCFPISQATEGAAHRGPGEGRGSQWERGKATGEPMGAAAGQGAGQADLSECLECQDSWPGLHFPGLAWARRQARHPLPLHFPARRTCIN